MFIAFVGMRNAKLIVANAATFVGLGSFADKEVQTACSGLALILILMVRKVNGAILIGVRGRRCWGCCAELRVGQRGFSRCRMPRRRS